MITMIIFFDASGYLSRGWLRNQGQTPPPSYNLARDRSPRSHYT
jgi:hypothetical protein